MEKSLVSQRLSLLFIIGVTVLGTGPIAMGHGRSHQESKSNKEIPSKPSLTSGFKTVRVSDGFTKDGGHVHTWEILAPDGKSVYHYYACFGSPAGAAKEVEIVLKDQIRILQRDPKIDRQGKAVGERILGSFKDPRNPPKKVVRLIWTGDSTLHEIYSESIDDVLGLERSLLK